LYSNFTGLASDRIKCGSGYPTYAPLESPLPWSRKGQGLNAAAVFQSAGDPRGIHHSIDGEWRVFAA